MRCQSTIDDIDDGGFACAIVANQANTFACADGEIGAVQRLDGAEDDFDAACGDDFLPLDDVIHEQNANDLK